MSNTILIGDAGRIDFLTPISMTSQQKNNFIDLLHELYSVVKEEFVDEFRHYRLGSREIHAKWDAQEYYTLLQLENYKVISEKLGRTEMSIIMRTGAIFPRLFSWCEEKEISFDNITLKNIEAFIEEKEAKKLEKREKRKLRTKISHKIDKMLNDAKNPCMIEDAICYGGECKNGFHKGCMSCPSGIEHIKTEEDVKLFNEVYQEDFVEE